MSTLFSVEAVDNNGITFDNGWELFSDHQQDCCETHYLDFSNLTLEDFSGLQFDLTDENFFQEVSGYGIRLVPVNGWPIDIPGYGSNNGYYSSDLSLVLRGPGLYKEFDISDCQEIGY